MRAMKAVNFLMLLVIAVVIASTGAMVARDVMASGVGGFPSRIGTDLTVSKSTPAITLNASGSSDAAIIFYEDGGVNRWAVSRGTDGNFYIGRYDASGVFQDYPIVISASDGSLSSTRACASGYTRKGLDYCERNSWSYTALVRDVCTTDSSLPSEAKAVNVSANTVANSDNAAGIVRYSKVFLYAENTCVTLRRSIGLAYGYEFSAVASTKIVASDLSDVRASLDSSQDFFVKFDDDSGDNASGSYGITGYWD